jgi:hypothetical protein
MVLKRKTAKQLASLSTLGAGALLIGAPDANATVTYSGVINAQVGFDTGSGFLSSFTSPALGAGGPEFKFSTKSINAGTVHHRKVSFSHVGPLNFLASGGLKLVAAGATWSTSLFGPQPAAHGVVASRLWDGPNAFSASVNGPASFNNKFALFQFGPSDDMYGWVQLSLSVTAAHNATVTNGPNLTIIDYAFDTTPGEKLAAGAQTGPVGQGTPEPATLGELSLGALALGALGLRRWRAARTA